MSARQLEALRQELSDIDAKRAAVVTARDEMIRADYTAGASIADLVRATGLTRTMLYKITAKEDA